MGTFTWIVDGKDRSKVTDWELWWSLYAQGALATISMRRPSFQMDGADYSYFDRFCGPAEDGSSGIDLKLLLNDLRFSASSEPGLELVDILVTATRRALVGHLECRGWAEIRRLMIHRREPYINFIALGTADVIRHPPYMDVVRCFSTGGKPMVTAAMAKRALNGDLPGQGGYKV